MIPTLNFNKIYKHTENDKFKNKIQQFCIFLIKMKFMIRTKNIIKGEILNIHRSINTFFFKYDYFLILNY